MSVTSAPASRAPAAATAASFWLKESRRRLPPNTRMRGVVMVLFFHPRSRSFRKTQACKQTTAAPGGGLLFRQALRGYLQKILRPLPVSRKDFMLESTRGQPPETFLTIVEPSLKFPCVTVRNLMSAIASISNVTRDLSARSSGSAQDSTRRLGGVASRTLPVIQTSPSGLWCSHFDPFF